MRGGAADFGGRAQLVPAVSSAGAARHGSAPAQGLAPCGFLPGRAAVAGDDSVPVRWAEVFLQGCASNPRGEGSRAGGLSRTQADAVFLQK